MRKTDKKKRITIAEATIILCVLAGFINLIKEGNYIFALLMHIDIMISIFPERITERKFWIKFLDKTKGIALITMLNIVALIMVNRLFPSLSDDYILNQMAEMYMLAVDIQLTKKYYIEKKHNVQNKGE